MTTRDRLYEFAFLALTLAICARVAAWGVVLPLLGVAWLIERFA